MPTQIDIITKASSNPGEPAQIECSSSNYTNYRRALTRTLLKNGLTHEVDFEFVKKRQPSRLYLVIHNPKSEYEFYLKGGARKTGPVIWETKRDTFGETIPYFSLGEYSNHGKERSRMTFLNACDVIHDYWTLACTGSEPIQLRSLAHKIKGTIHFVNTDRDEIEAVKKQCIGIGLGGPKVRFHKGWMEDIFPKAEQVPALIYHDTEQQWGTETKPGVNVMDSVQRMMEQNMQLHIAVNVVEDDWRGNPNNEVFNSQMVIPEGYELSDYMYSYTGKRVPMTTFMFSSALDQIEPGLIRAGWEPYFDRSDKAIEIAATVAATGQYVTDETAIRCGHSPPDFYRPFKGMDLEEWRLTHGMHSARVHPADRPKVLEKIEHLITV